MPTSKVLALVFTTAPVTLAMVSPLRYTVATAAALTLSKYLCSSPSLSVGTWKNLLAPSPQRVTVICVGDATCQMSWLFWLPLPVPKSKARDAVLLTSSTRSVKATLKAWPISVGQRFVMSS